MKAQKQSRSDDLVDHAPGVSRWSTSISCSSVHLVLEPMTASGLRCFRLRACLESRGNNYAGDFHRSHRSVIAVSIPGVVAASVPDCETQDHRKPRAKRQASPPSLTPRQVLPEHPCATATAREETGDYLLPDSTARNARLVPTPACPQQVMSLESESGSPGSV